MTISRKRKKKNQEIISDRWETSETPFFCQIELELFLVSDHPVLPTLMSNSISTDFYILNYLVFLFSKMYSFFNLICYSHVDISS